MECQDVAEVALHLHKGADDLACLVQQSADDMKGAIAPLVDLPKPLLKETDPSQLSQLRETFSKTYMCIFNTSAAFLRCQIDSLKAAGESKNPPPLDKSVTPSIFKTICKTMCQKLKEMVSRAQNLGSEISEGAKAQIRCIKEFFHFGGSPVSSLDSSDSSDSSLSGSPTSSLKGEATMDDVLQGYQMLIQTFGVYLDVYRDMHELTLRFASLCVVFVVGVPQWGNTAIASLRQSSTRVLESMTSSAVCCLTMSNVSHAMATLLRV